MFRDQCGDRQHQAGARGHDRAAIAARSDSGRPAGANAEVGAVRRAQRAPAEFPIRGVSTISRSAAVLMDRVFGVLGLVHIVDHPAVMLATIWVLGKFLRRAATLPAKSSLVAELLVRPDDSPLRMNGSAVIGLSK